MTAAVSAQDFEWQLRGVCRGLIEDDVFFPDRKGTKAVAQAKRICNGPDLAAHPELACPVRQQCLAWALSAQEPYGVWGGLDRYERASILGIPIGR